MVLLQEEVAVTLLGPSLHVVRVDGEGFVENVASAYELHKLDVGGSEVRVVLRNVGIAAYSLFVLLERLREFT